ncbi:MAG: hypothetical protein NTX96_00730 [Candidatus Zambryskibacteria bacterium]|nr:hypothetical protein [Candidatus Zambryskibacteria bacterium]
MSIQNIIEKIKPFYNLLLVIVVASIFFVLGRLSALEERHTPIKIGYPNTTQTASVVQTVSTNTDTSVAVSGLSAQTGEVIGSKSGKKYYFPWCGTVKMIKPENQVKFASAEEARSAGYTPALNCKGLK